MSPIRADRRFFIIIAAAFVLTACFASPVYAHKVFVFAWVEGDQVCTDSYYSKSRKVKNGTISVHDSSGNKIHEGQSDENGAFCFIPSVRDDLTITLEAGMGHKGEFLLEKSELPENLPDPSSGAPATNLEEPTNSEEKSHVSLQINPDEIKKQVEAALDDKLKPVMRAIAELKKEDDSPDIKDIVGGLGWIMGLMGLFLYFKRPKS